jgi:hypothetical protein
MIRRSTRAHRGDGHRRGLSDRGEKSFAPSATPTRGGALFAIADSF